MIPLSMLLENLSQLQVKDQDPLTLTDTSGYNLKITDMAIAMQQIANVSKKHKHINYAPMIKATR